MIASWELLGRLAQEPNPCLPNGKPRFRVARAAYSVADHMLLMSCHYGKYKLKPELAETMPPWWREHFAAIVRTAHEYESLVRPGDYFLRRVGSELKLFRRQH